MADLETNDNSPAGPDQPLPEELEVAVPPAEENSVPEQDVRQIKIFCFKFTTCINIINNLTNI